MTYKWQFFTGFKVYNFENYKGYDLFEKQKTGLINKIHFSIFSWPFVVILPLSCRKIVGKLPNTVCI